MAAFTSILLGVGAAASVAGTAMNYGAQRKGARAAEAEAAHRARIAGVNADLAEAEAADILVRGEQEVQKHRGAVRQFSGAQRVALAAQGIDINSGSAGVIQEETARLGELDAQQIRNNARRVAWGLEVEAYNLRQTGDLTLAAGRNQAAAMRTASFGTLLTGASNLAGMAYSSGMFSRGGSGVRVPQGTTAPSSYRG